MTASKNSENITAQLLSSCGHCPVYVFPYGRKSQPFLPKCGLFIKFQIIHQWRMSKEMKDFKKSKTKTLKTKTSKGKTSKGKTSKAKTSKTKTSKTKTSKTKTSKTKTPKYLSRESFFIVFFWNSFPSEINCLMTASKNPENIIGQMLSSCGHCPVCIFPYGLKAQKFLPKCGLFH